MKSFGFCCSFLWIAIVIISLLVVQGTALDVPLKGVENGTSFAGLVIQPGLLTAVWPATEPTVKGYSLRWTVDGLTQTKKDLPPSQRNYSLTNIDRCANVSVEVLKTQNDLSDKVHAQIHFNDTDNLMLQPTVTYPDNKLFVDWSDIWRCTKAITFNLTMKTQSGHVVYEEHDIPNTSKSLAYRPDCEQTEVCITAGTASGHILGTRCVSDIRPFKRDKPSKPRLKRKESGDLSVEFTWPDSCSPSLVSVIVRSKTRSELVHSSRSKTDRVTVPHPNWCSNCLVYVVASYPYLQDEISEPAILLGHEVEPHSASESVQFVSPDCFTVKYEDRDRRGVRFQILKRYVYSATWKPETNCSMILFHAKFRESRFLETDSELFMDGNTCVVVTWPFLLYVSMTAVSTSGDVIDFQETRILDTRDDTMKICTIGGSEVHLYTNYRRTANDRDLKVHNAKPSH